MNDLRMYVEHLFEGKVLTADMIELKEEVYGNLVARYEDYVASGMDEAEALERTKASMTDIDEVLEGERADEAVEGSAAAPADAPAPQDAAAPTDEAQVQAPPESAVADESAASGPAGEEAAGEATPRPTGAPVPPDVDGAFVQGAAAVGATPGAPAAAPKKRWPIVIGIIAAVLAFAVVGSCSLGMFVEPALDYAEDTVENVVDADDAAERAEDQREYEMTSDLDDATATHQGAGLKPYVGDGAGRTDLVRTLPLGAYLTAEGAEGVGVGGVAFTYTNVPEAIDGDAIERAILYNAVAMLCVYPDLSSVMVSVAEEHDSPADADSYRFVRSTLEHAYSNASQGAITQLNTSLFESEESWDQVRDYLFREKFRERQLDLAEQD